MARIFNTYGPRMLPDDGRVISHFIVLALRGEPITIYGDGSQTRSFCYVDDMVSGLLLLMMKGPDDVTGPLINVGNPSEVTIKRIAELIVAMTGSRAPLVFQPLPADDPRQRQPDIALARAALGWEPSVALEAGLERTIAYFRSLRV